MRALVRTAGALAGALLACAAAAPAAHAQAAATSICDPRDQRAAELPRRAPRGRREHRADWWWGGWLGFYATGTVVQSVRAGLEEQGKRADYIVSAVKALFGTGRLLYARPNARLGAEPMLAVPLEAPADCSARLGIGEETLRKNAHESDSRWSWKRHLFNVGINVIGGVIVAEGFGAEQRGWTSAGIGIAVGEAMILSTRLGLGDLEEYDRRFPASGVPAEPPTTWNLVPWPGGIGLAVRF